jgi:hypothetical protein
MWDCNHSGNEVLGRRDRHGDTAVGRTHRHLVAIADPQFGRIVDMHLRMLAAAAAHQHGELCIHKFSERGSRMPIIRNGKPSGFSRRTSAAISAEISSCASRIRPRR